MQELIQAVATHLNDAGFAEPVVWENLKNSRTVPRYEVYLGPSKSTTKAYSGLNQSDFLIQIDCVVTVGTGLATQIQMIDQIATRFKAGTQLSCGHVTARPVMGPPSKKKSEYRRPITISVRVLA